MNIARSKPLSPHLGIYKPQISSVLSIMHRISGVANFFGTMIITWAIIMSIFSTKWHLCICKIARSEIGIAFFILWTYSLCFHTCTGIRHLFWDTGKGFAVKTMEKTGIFAILSSILLFVIVWLYALKMI